MVHGKNLKRGSKIR